jgi:hypothetical protein
MGHPKSIPDWRGFARVWVFQMIRCTDDRMSRFPLPLPGYPPSSQPSQFGVDFRGFGLASG